MGIFFLGQSYGGKNVRKTPASGVTGEVRCAARARRTICPRGRVRGRRVAACARGPTGCQLDHPWGTPRQGGQEDLTIGCVRELQKQAEQR